MTLDEFAEGCRVFLIEQEIVGPETAAQIGLDNDLLAGGVLDSFGLLNLVMHAEDVSGTPIDVTELDIQDFSSVRALHALVSR